MGHEDEKMALTAQKFMFDLDFDDPNGTHARKAAEKATAEEEAKAQADAGDTPAPEAAMTPEPQPEPEPEPEPVIPTFSEEELEAARQEGYRRGHQDGMAEMAKDSENILAQALNTIAQQMTQSMQAQAQASEKMVRDGTHIAMALVQKLFPHMKHRHGVDEVEQLVEEALQRITDEPKILIQVAPALMEEVRDKVEKLSRQNGYDGHVVVRADKTMEIGDCNIQWGEGGAERNSTSLWQQIDEAVFNHIGESDFYPYVAPPAPAMAPTDMTEEALSEKPADVENEDVRDETPEERVFEDIVEEAADDADTIETAETTVDETAEDGEDDILKQNETPDDTPDGV